MTNLTATAFTPMLDTLKPILDTTNSIVGATQGWAKEHPAIAKYATTIVGIGGVTLTLYGTLRAGQTAWAMWRIASSLALKGTAADAVVTQGAVSGLATPIKISIIATEVMVVLRLYQELKRTIEDTKRLTSEADQGNRQTYQALLSQWKTMPTNDPLRIGSQRMMGQTALTSLDREGSLKGDIEGGPAALYKSYFQIPEKVRGGNAPAARSIRPSDVRRLGR